MAPCPHLSLVIKVDKDDLLAKAYGTCSVCQWKQSRLWACLQGNCQFVGCSESVQDHSTKHHKEFKHAIAINLTTFRIWCYECQCEVHLPSVINPSEMKALKKYRLKNSVHSAPRNSVEQNTDMTDRRRMNDERDSVNFGAVGMDTDQMGNDLDMTRGLIGLRNLGNTCYMNSAIQAISNCLPLTYHFLTTEIATDKKPSMAKNYSKLICDMWQPSRYSCIAPSGLHSTLKSINPAFRGYSQQDAQEFLRCLMDCLHEELKYPFPTWVVQQQNAVSNGEVEHMDVDEHTGNENINSGSAPSGENIPQSNRDEGNAPTLHGSSEGRESDRSQVPSVSAATPIRRLDSNLHGLESSQQPNQRADDVMETENHNQHVQKSTENSCNNSNKPDVKIFSGKKNKIRKTSNTRYRSIISDIFDGELRSSVQCLTCDQVSHTKETFQDLSLPIPGKDDLTRLHCMTTNSPASGSSAMPVVPGFKGSPCSESYSTTATVYNSMWNVWEWLKSWVWGPQITLNDCLSAFFSADELKGDNMYSCEKCKKLRNGVKYCKLLKLPEVLCVHLKRFRHEYLMSYSSKISSPVSFPSTSLDLRPFLAQDVPSDCTNYDLCSVVVHLGNAGGGHYTTYAKNFLNNKWYEFDDQFVTQVSESTVTAAEAYVLFYCKSSVESTRARDRIYSLIQEEINKLPHNASSSLMCFHISLKWLHKFLTFTDPGPIDNSDFVCRHLDIQPQKYEILDQITFPVTERLWQEIHSRFGGGPVMTRPVPCRICAEELVALEERRTAERDIFVELNRRSRDSGPGPSILYINLDWFGEWEDFVNAKTTECPGEINNEPICLKKDGKYVLKKNSSYAPITDRAWQHLFSIYGGGPVVRVRSNNLGSASSKVLSSSAKTIQKNKEPEKKAASESIEKEVTFENHTATADEEKPKVAVV